MGYKSYRFKLSNSRHGSSSINTPKVKMCYNTNYGAKREWKMHFMWLATDKQTTSQLNLHSEEKKSSHLLFKLHDTNSFFRSMIIFIISHTYYDESLIFDSKLWSCMWFMICDYILDQSVHQETFDHFRNGNELCIVFQSCGVFVDWIFQKENHMCTHELEN